MSIQLRKEQNDYIDKILSKGLDEINNIPYYDISTISNTSNTINNDSKNKLNLKIPTKSDFDIYNIVKNKKGYFNKNISLNGEERKEIFFNSTDNKKFNDISNKYSFEINKNFNNRIKQKTLNNLEENKENNSNLIISCNIPNNKEIIENALYNNQKNINKINKRLTGNSLSSSQSKNNYNKNEANISSSTRNLIDKYIDLKSSTYSKNDSFFNDLKNSTLQNSDNNKINNDIMNIHDLSCINNIQDTKNNRYKKYNPKSSTLKQLIKKLKKDDEYEETRNKNNNNDFNKSNYSIQVSSFADSGLFTLGNSNLNSSAERTKIKKVEIFKNENRNKYDKNKSKKEYKSELYNSNILKAKNIRTFDKIMDSNNNNKYNKIDSEMDLIRDRIKKISLYLNLNESTKMESLIYKNNSMKSLLKSKYKIKNLYFPISSVLSIGNLSYIKNNKKIKSKSVIDLKTKKEEKIYMIKYKELREKFEAQREKMKKEKENVIFLNQKIKLFNKKLEKYPELVEFNKTLNEQNIILINNLNYSDDVRKKQANLIEVLQNQIKKIKNL